MEGEVSPETKLGEPTVVDQQFACTTNGISRSQDEERKQNKGKRVQNGTNEDCPPESKLSAMLEEMVSGDGHQEGHDGDDGADDKDVRSQLSRAYGRDRQWYGNSGCKAQAESE